MSLGIKNLICIKYNDSFNVTPYPLNIYLHVW